MSTIKYLYYTILVCISISFLPACERDTKDPEPMDSTKASFLENIKYGTYTDNFGLQKDLVLDLYIPAKKTQSTVFPLAVMIHGGGYVEGDKKDTKSNCLILADSGFVVASINYRLGWNNGSGNCDGDPASQQLAAYRALQDANAALRFLTEKASTYSIDTNWVFIGGNSAGASTSLNTAYISEKVAATYFAQAHDLLGPVNSVGNEYRNSFSIKGICNMWGALPDSTLMNQKNSIPTISFHGTADKVIPYNMGYNNLCENYTMLFGSYCIHRQLIKYDKPSVTNFVIGGGHGPNAYTHDFLMSNTACFWKRIIKGTSIKGRIDTSLKSSCN